LQLFWKILRKHLKVVVDFWGRRYRAGYDKQSGGALEGAAARPSSRHKTEET